MQAVPWTRRTPLTVASACSSAARPTAPVRLHRKRKTGKTFCWPILLGSAKPASGASPRGQGFGLPHISCSNLKSIIDVHHRAGEKGQASGITIPFEDAEEAEFWQSAANDAFEADDMSGKEELEAEIAELEQRLRAVAR